LPDLRGSTAIDEPRKHPAGVALGVIADRVRCAGGGHPAESHRKIHVMLQHTVPQGAILTHDPATSSVLP
jgi:hypothetical protein